MVPPLMRRRVGVAPYALGATRCAPTGAGLVDRALARRYSHPAEYASSYMATMLSGCVIGWML